MELTFIGKSTSGRQQCWHSTLCAAGDLSSPGMYIYTRLKDAGTASEYACAGGFADSELMRVCFDTSLNTRRYGNLPYNSKLQLTVV
jgi:hypothetical protein